MSADSEEKREPVSDIDTAVVDSLKAFDPKRPISEADMAPSYFDVCFTVVRSTGQSNTACSLSAGVSKPKVFRGR
jgi:hypothetical protein